VLAAGQMPGGISGVQQQTNLSLLMDTKCLPMVNIAQTSKSTGGYYFHDRKGLNTQTLVSSAASASIPAQSFPIMMYWVQ
jgi:hypothetical protein